MEECSLKSCDEDFLFKEHSSHINNIRSYFIPQHHVFNVWEFEEKTYQAEKPWFQ